MKRAAISIAAGKKTGTTKNCSKTGKQKRGRRNAAYFWLGWLFCQVARGTKERGDKENSSNRDFNETQESQRHMKTFNSEHRTQETQGL